MNEFNKYKLLSEGKAFGDRAKIALVLLDSKTAYEELKVEGAQTSVCRRNPNRSRLCKRT